jgi:hypothetical protein
MQKIEELVQEVVDRAKKLGISTQGLSRLAGLHKNTLKGYKKPGWSPTTLTLKQLQDTIMDLETLSPENLLTRVDDAGIHPPKGLRKALSKKNPSTTRKPKNTSECASADS